MPKELYFLPKNKSAGEFKMANFIEQEWGGYNIRLRPSDSLRAFIGRWGLDSWILYFNSSNIYFDLVVYVPDDDLYKEIKDNISFEWVLCDGNNEPIQKKNLKGFSFFEPFGEGVMPFTTNKKEAKALIKQGELYKYAKGNGFIALRKTYALKIGRLTRANEYNVVMRFKSKKDELPSVYMPMANFTVFIRDRFIHTIWLGVIAVFFTTIIALILRVCGLQP